MKYFFVSIIVDVFEFIVVVSVGGIGHKCADKNYNRNCKKHKHCTYFKAETFKHNLCSKIISYTAFGYYISRNAGVIFDFFTKSSDGNINSSYIAVEFIIPHLVKKLFS